MEILGILFSPGEIFLLGAAGSLALVFIGIRGTRESNRANNLRLAVHAYKSAFAPEIAAVSNNSYAIDTFANAFQRHADAVNSIRPILPMRHQRKLQKAWNEYCGKNTDLGLEPEEYVQAFNAMLYSTNKEMFGELKKRFTALHGCLNDLL